MTKNLIQSKNPYSFNNYVDKTLTNIIFDFHEDDPLIILNSTFNNTTFIGCILRNVIFMDCNMRDCDMSASRVYNMQLYNCILSENSLLPGRIYDDDDDNEL